MTGLPALALPILLSAVFVFAASFVLHMLLPWHRNDYSAVPQEQAFLDAIRPVAPPPGDYMVPRASGPEEMRSPAFAEKLKKGPVLMLTVLPQGPFSMGKNLVQWLVYCVAVSFLAAYVTGRALPPGTQSLRVFQIGGATAFIGYAVALWQMSIWLRRSWLTTLKGTVDGLIYGLLTAGTFGWLWPR
jgi:hypothetical protein